jgi:hypothetical protein
LGKIKLETDEDIQKVLAETSIANGEYVIPGASKFSAEILGHKIELGPTEHVMSVIRCINADELRQKLAASDILGETLDVMWEVNWKTCYSRFPQFLGNKPSEN